MMTYPGRDHFHKVTQETSFLHIIERVIALRVLFFPLSRSLMSGIEGAMR